VHSAGYLTSPRQAGAGQQERLTDKYLNTSACPLPAMTADWGFVKQGWRCSPCSTLSSAITPL